MSMFEWSLATVFGAIIFTLAANGPLARLIPHKPYDLQTGRLRPGYALGVLMLQVALFFCGMMITTYWVQEGRLREDPVSLVEVENTTTVRVRLLHDQSFVSVKLIGIMPFAEDPDRDALTFARTNVTIGAQLQLKRLKKGSIQDGKVQGYLRGKWPVGTDLAENLLEAGMVRVDPNSRPVLSVIAGMQKGAEDMARRSQRGLWHYAGNRGERRDKTVGSGCNGAR